MSTLIYGMHAVTALLTYHPDVVTRLVLQNGRDDVGLQRCQSLADGESISITHLPKKEIDELFKDRAVHQGIVAECTRLPVYLEADLEGLLEASSKPRRVLILDNVQDPHNLGACLRVANAMGVCCVIAPKDKSVGLTSTVMKVSCGAAFATPFVQVTNLVRAMQKLQDLGLWIVGASEKADKLIKDIDTAGDIAIAMGAEGGGLRRLTEKHCDFLAKIPMQGTVESLNVSVAAGICLYECIR